MSTNLISQKIFFVIILTQVALSQANSAHASPIELHEKLVNNVNAGLYISYDQPITTDIQTNSPILIVGGIIAYATYTCLGLPDCQADLNRAYNWVKNQLFDPQNAFLISSFKVNNVEYIDNLIATSILPEHILGQFSLPNFLGGATYTATDAFLGTAFDKGNNIIPGVTVGYGILETNNGMDYLVATNFGNTLLDLFSISYVEYDLRPGMPSEQITATMREMLVFDDQASLAAFTSAINSFDPSAVPEPASMILFGTGIAGLVGSSIERKKK